MTSGERIKQPMTVRFGGNLFINTPNVLVYKGQPFLTVEQYDDGVLGVDFSIYDGSGKECIKVSKSIPVWNDGNYDFVKSHDGYDAFFSWNGVRKYGDIRLMSIKRTSQDEANGISVDVNFITYLPDGRHMYATPIHLELPGANIITGCVFKNGTNGINIG